MARVRKGVQEIGAESIIRLKNQDNIEDVGSLRREVKVD